MRLVEIFHAGDRLRQHGSIIQRQRRHEAHRIHRAICWSSLLADALRQVDEFVVRLIPFNASAMHTRHAADERK